MFVRIITNKEIIKIAKKIRLFLRELLLIDGIRLLRSIELITIFAL